MNRVGGGKRSSSIDMAFGMCEYESAHRGLGHENHFQFVFAATNRRYGLLSNYFDLLLNVPHNTLQHYNDGKINCLNRISMKHIYAPIVTNNL